MKANKQHRGPSGWILMMCMAVLVLAGCGQHQGNLQTGARYQSEGKYRAAYIEAKKVLQREPDNAAAWLLLGKASLMLGNPGDAVSELEKAHAHGIDDSQWALPMGQAWLATRKFARIGKELPHGESFSPGLRASLDALRGDALRSMNQPEQARKAYAAALALEPHHVRALLGLSWLDMKAQRPDAARKHVEKALRFAPRSSPAWAGKASLEFADGNLSRAETDYAKALKIDQRGWLPQERFAARMRLADVQARRREYDKALANIEMLEKMSPDQPYPHYLHAAVLYQQGKFDDAVSQLQQVLKVDPDNMPAQMLLGAVNYAQGNYGQVEMYLSNVLGTDNGNATARKLLALTQYREGRPEQALGTLRPVVPKGRSDTALLAELQKASVDRAGKPGSAGATALSGEARGDAADVSHGGELARAAQALHQGDAAQAIRMLEKMTPKDAQAQTRRMALLVQAWVRDGKPGKAVEAAAAHVARHPDDSSAHLIQGTALLADGKRDAARAQYETALRIDHGNRAALLDLGNLDSLEGHSNQARDRYEQVLQADPHNVPAMIALARLALSGKKKAQAVDWFRRAIKADPAAPGAYVDLMMLYSRDGRFDAAAAVADKLTAAAPENPAALNALGATQINAGHPEKALRPLHKAVRLAPRVALYRVNLARAQILDKDPSAAKANLEKVVATDPGRVRAVSLLASMKGQEHDLTGALKLARALRMQPGKEQAGLALEGDLYMAAKAYDKAAEAYRMGLKKSASRPLVVKRYLALVKAGAEQPDRVLRQWLDQHPQDAPMRMYLAQYYLDHQRMDRAATEYEQLLKAYPSNIQVLNNLAWIYTGQKPSRAVALASHAYKLDPKSAGIMDTYAWALLANGQAKTALPILRRAVAAAPGVPTLQYHLAVAQARNGDRSGARATLVALARNHADYPEKQAAEKLFRKLDDVVTRRDGP